MKPFAVGLMGTALPWLVVSYSPQGAPSLLLVVVMVLSAGMVAGCVSQGPAGIGLTTMAAGAVVGAIGAQWLVDLLIAPQIPWRSVQPSDEWIERLRFVGVNLAVLLPIEALGYAIGSVAARLHRRALP